MIRIFSRRPAPKLDPSTVRLTLRAQMDARLEQRRRNRAERQREAVVAIDREIGRLRQARAMFGGGE